MATVCIEDIPPGSQIGLDLRSWQSGPNFRGLRDIPPGLHCLHITIANISTLKYAVWLNIESGVTLAFKWDKVGENLQEIDHTYAVSGGGISRMFLIECPSEDDKQWTSITQHLETPAVSQIIPLGRCVTSSTTSNTDTAGQDLSHLGPHVIDPDEVKFHFVPIDLKRSWPKGSIGREITEHALDKTWLLKDVMRRAGNEHLLLNQFEFCFLGVLLYGSATCFDQWNTILSLVCTTKTALIDIPEFASTFLSVLHAQAEQLSHDLYGDVFSFALPRQLKKMQANITECEGVLPTSVTDNLEILLDFLSREFGAEEDNGQQQNVYDAGDGLTETEGEEDDEEKPVIVELER